jgi:hypothetical protein
VRKERRGGEGRERGGGGGREVDKRSWQKREK